MLGIFHVQLDTSKNYTKMEDTEMKNCSEFSPDRPIKQEEEDGKFIV